MRLRRRGLSSRYLRQKINHRVCFLPGEYAKNLEQPQTAYSRTFINRIGIYGHVTEVTKEAVWLRRLLSEIHAQDLQTPTTIHGDNQGSLNLAHNPVYHGRTKHIEVRHHFIREKILSGEVSVDYVPTNEQLADILTKALGRTTFERLRGQLGLVKIENSET